MKFLIVLISSLIGFSNAQASVPAFKTKIVKEFSLNSFFDAGDRVYFNCQTVENTMTDMLTKMGAQDVSVQCYGGIQENLPSDAWEASVRASYTTLQASPNGNIPSDYKAVSLDSYDSCYLLSQLFTNVEDSFNIKDLTGNTSCPSLDSRMHLKMSTLF